jgi:CHASE3 domain sensor protein
VHSESNVEAAELTRAQWGDLLSAMEDAETGERGFVITGRESYLEPFQWGQAKTYQELALLPASIHGDPAQTMHLQTLQLSSRPDELHVKHHPHPAR